MNPAEQIKATLCMREVGEKYGYYANRAGYICCPFHKEKTPSLMLYSTPGRGWHCFGCGAGGSPIDFVMQLFHINFRQAVLRMNYDFQLGLTTEKADIRTQTDIAKKRQEEMRRNQLFAKEYTEKTNLFRLLWDAKKRLAPASPSEEWHPLYVMACHELPQLEYWFETHPYDRRWEQLTQ